MSKNSKSLTISIDEVKTLLKKAEDNQLGSESALIATLARLVLLLWQVIDEKKLSISRLRKLIFGSKSEKHKQSQAAFARKVEKEVK